MQTYPQKVVQKLKLTLGTLGFGAIENTSICMDENGLGFQIFFHEPKKQLCVSIFMVSNAEGSSASIHRTNFPSFIDSIWPEWSETECLVQAATNVSVLDEQYRIYEEAFAKLVGLGLDQEDLVRQIRFIEMDPQYLEK